MESSAMMGFMREKEGSSDRQKEREIRINCHLKMIGHKM
jgi:hypothetical protein